MRTYDDLAVEVTSCTQDGIRAPATFVWRGRRYEIERVLDRWVTRSPWWRRALAPDGGVWALNPDLLDEQVWRVVAVTGAHAGIYDLAVVAVDRWRVACVSD